MGATFVDVTPKKGNRKNIINEKARKIKLVKM